MNYALVSICLYSMLKYVLLLLLTQTILQTTFLTQNNVCKTFGSYHIPAATDNCYHDPDTKKSTPELIKKYADVFENHVVTSEDGYILTLFRIPRINPKGVVLIHHSIATYSRIYLWQGNNSLALKLWKEGFDVWLANHRGTLYSNKHVNMSNWNYNYWNFSFHEIGFYDVKAEVEYIREQTNGSKIIFAGHSLGSCAGLIYASLRPEEANNYLHSMILLAAPAYLDHVTSGVMYIKGLAPITKASTNFLRIGSVVSLHLLLLQIAGTVLKLFPTFIYTTNLMVLSLCGYTPEETDPTFFNYDATVYLDNFSWKTVFHFAQLINAPHRFEMYDYGKNENFEVYGTEIPPVYPIEKISVPLLMVSSVNDTLITLKDSETLFEDLPKKAKVYGHWKLSGLNHLDYLLGIHRNEMFVGKFLEFLNRIASDR